MSQPLRWGILGTGNIAQKFARQIPQTPRARFVAVGSRSAESAAAFVANFAENRLAEGVDAPIQATAHSSYEALLANPEVEAVYISLPNSLHHKWTIEALEAGKHVLCEKPMATTAAEAQAMFEVASRTGRLLVEAFMYRCHPAVQAMIQTVRGGEIGQVKLIRTHFTFNRPANAADVRYQPELDGGSLRDVGCYCINLARALAGTEPTAMHAAFHRHALGVDDYAAGILDFDGRILCTFTCGMTVEADRTTYVGGSEGYVAMATPWFSDGTFTLSKLGETSTERADAPMDLYALEADAFARSVRDGADPWISKADTLGNLRVLDRLLQSHP